MSRSSKSQKKPVKEVFDQKGKKHRDPGITNQFGMRCKGNHIRSLLMNLFDCETSFASGRNKPHYTHGDSMIMIGRACNPKTHIRNLLFEQIKLMEREDYRVSATAKRSLLQLLQVIDKLPNDMLEEIYTYYMPLQNKDRKKICCNNQP